MLQNTEPNEIDTDEAFEAFSVLPGDLAMGLLVVVDHAASDLPPNYGSLGLEAHQLKRHIAYDIGVKAVAQHLNDQLQVPVVLSNFSRLLIDPNRGEEDPTLIMRISDGAIIPENAAIDEKEIEKRKAQFYRPYHAAITNQIEAFLAQDIVPVILSIHSFTHEWRGDERPWHAGVLWDQDPRFARPLISALAKDQSLIVGDNQPYTGKLKGDCMFTHGTCRGLAHALLEIRQDLIADNEGQTEWGERVSTIIRELIDDNSLIAPCREIRHYGCYADQEICNE